MNLSNLSKLLFAEDTDVHKADEDDSTPKISKNIEKFSVQYRKHVVSEMTEELNKQARQAEQIKIVKANPKAV